MPSLRIVYGDNHFLSCKVSLGLAGVADHTRFPATEMRALKHRSLKKKKKTKQEHKNEKWTLTGKTRKNPLAPLNTRSHK